MLTYNYVAKDPVTGDKVKSSIQADNEHTAAKLLKSQGLAPIQIEVAKGMGGSSGIAGRIKAKDKILLFRQLSTLINAGLPLVQSLRTVAGQVQNKKLRIVVNQIISDVEAGKAFSVALGVHPEVFNQIVVNLVAAGETSGTLDAALERIATQQEKDAEILSKVRGAMVYPAIVILVMLGVLGFMIITVLPQVQTLYDGLGGSAKLPLITRILLAISNFTINYWWVILIILGVLGFFTTRWVRTLGGRRVVDRYKMRGWPINTLFMKLYMARFARTSTTLIASGVPLLQILDITGRSINNVHIEDSIIKAASKVKGGTSLSDALTGDSNFLPLVPDMLRIGEQSGAMEAMTAKVADYYEKEVDQQIKTISTIIEPVLMVVLGVVAFIIVAAVLLPIYGLAGQNFIN